MQEDFHYYATYCASYLAGYDHEESMAIAYSSQFVDLCSATLLKKIKAPVNAATTQLQLELMDSRTDLVGLHNITRIWSSFHFLPADLNAPIKAGKRYRNKYRLICGPNGELLKKTVELAKGKGPQAAGIAMHILADTWAHRYFAGTPSLVINNTNYYFYELTGEGDETKEQLIEFRHSPSAPDDLENGKYTNSVFQGSENNVMNLGHGRAGHLPDYCFMRYKYMPSWGNYAEVVKDNPSDYMHAFCQMVYALRYLRGEISEFKTDTYDKNTAIKHVKEIKSILTKRQLSASADWKAFGEKLSGRTIDDYDIDKYQLEYIDAPEEEKAQTFLGRFTEAAIAQKGMVTNAIYTSGNRLAGISVEVKSND